MNPGYLLDFWTHIMVSSGLSHNSLLFLQSFSAAQHWFCFSPTWKTMKYSIDQTEKMNKENILRQ